MKKLFIIDTYPKTEKQIQLLKDCINSVTPIGWDILIVSHYRNSKYGNLFNI